MGGQLGSFLLKAGSMPKLDQAIMLLSSQVLKSFNDKKNPSKPPPMPNYVALASISLGRRLPDGREAFSETRVMSV